MTTYEVRPWHFFIPFLIVLLAGWLKSLGWSPWVYMLGFVAAVACILWMFFYTWVTHKANNDAWEAHKIETYLRLDPDQRVELGYKKAAPRITVETNYIEPHTGFAPRSTYDWIPWSEGKFQQWAIATLRGASLAYRQWEGSGRMFKDGEYERGIAKMIGLKYLTKDGPAVNSKVVLTREGVRALAGYLDEWKIPYELAPQFEEWLLREVG